METWYLSSPPPKNDHPWIASSTWCPNIIHRCPFDIAYKLLLSWAMAIVIFVIAVLGEDLSHSIQMDVTLGGLVFLYHKSNHAPPLVLAKFKVAKVVLFSSFDTGNKDLELSLFMHILRSTNGENQPLVSDEPVEFEKQSVDVQDFVRITRRSRRIYRICL